MLSLAIVIAATLAPQWCYVAAEVPPQQQQAATELHCVVYSAAWCGPCKVLKESIDRELVPLGWTVGAGESDIQFVDIDHEETPHLDRSQGIPQAVVLRAGMPAGRMVGAQKTGREFGLWLNSFGRWRKAKEKRNLVFTGE